MNAPSPRARGGHDLARRSAATAAALPPGSAAVKPVTSLPPPGGGVAGPNPRTFTLELEAGTRILSANNRLDRWTKNAVTQALKLQARELAKRKLPKIGRADVTVDYVSPPRTKAKRHPLASDCILDSDNIAPTAKALIDGIVKAGVFPSDSKKYVRKVTYILAPETHPRGLVRIHITEVTE